MHGAGERLHAALLVAVVREALEHLELAHPEVVLLERALERAVGAGMAVEQLTPGVDDGVVLGPGNGGHRAAFYQARAIDAMTILLVAIYAS